MGNQELDKLFKNKLTGSVRQPSEDVWNKIQGKMGQTKKNGFWFYGKIAAAVLLLAATTLIMINYNDSSKDKTGPQIAQNDEPPEADGIELNEYISNKDNSNRISTDSIDKTTGEKKIIIQNKEENSEKDQPSPAVKSEKKRPKHPTININSNEDNLTSLDNVPEDLAKKEEENIENSIPDATHATTIESTKQKDKAKGKTLTFNIEEFEKKEEVTVQTSEPQEDKSTFNKVINFAKNLKESDGLGELREAKNELFAFNFKKNDNSK